MQQDQLRSKFKDKFAALEYALNRQELRYTDDGQMTLAIAEHLADNPTIISNDLMRRFVAVYESWRGYRTCGGARMLIEAFRDNADYEFMAEHLFPGGSLGSNGAAMRDAPTVCDSLATSQESGKKPRIVLGQLIGMKLGTEGAQLIAVATSIAAFSNSPINPSILAEKPAAAMLYCCIPGTELDRLRKVKADEDIEQFGNGIQRMSLSLQRWLASHSIHRTIRQHFPRLWQGGDTDTIAAMTGTSWALLAGFETTFTFEARLEDGDSFIGFVRTCQSIRRIVGSAEDNRIIVGVFSFCRCLKAHSLLLHCDISV